ncbi:MAG: bacteriohemerythrin [Treponema sp.]|jgi:hemerythrin|nr:bacteriohemerythrin [Treponema sp.]
MSNIKTELVSWSPTFSVGIKLIDDQHKELLDLVNDMFNHVIGDDAAERVYFQKIIQKAVHYIRVHFTTEEKLMISTNFPGYAEHKKAHDFFVLTVLDIVRKFETEDKYSLSIFTKFLKEWVLTHIAIMDKLYFTYFKNIASRKANGTLGTNHLDAAAAR